MTFFQNPKVRRRIFSAHGAILNSRRILLPLMWWTCWSQPVMFFIALRTCSRALSYFFMYVGVKDIASDPYKRLSSRHTLTISFLKGTDKCLDDIASLYWLKFPSIAFVLFFISSSSLRSSVIILPRNLYFLTNRIQPPGTSSGCVASAAGFWHAPSY